MRYRLTANPGGKSNHWLVKNFIETPNTGSLDAFETVNYFWESKRADNPFLDWDNYSASFDLMDAAEKARMLHGDWYAVDDGMFDTSQFIPFTGDLKDIDYLYRSWDFAATESEQADYSVGIRVAVSVDAETGKGIYYVDSMERFRSRYDGVLARVKATAEDDGHRCDVVFEQEGGAAGAMLGQQIKDAVKPAKVRALNPRRLGDKVTRAKQLVAALGEGRVFLRQSMRGRSDLLEELRSFPDGQHDDAVDSLSYAVIAHESR